MEKQNASIFPYCLQYDRLKLKPALDCRHHHSVTGLSSGPMAYKEMGEIRKLGDKERRRWPA